MARVGSFAHYNCAYWSSDSWLEDNVENGVSTGIIRNLFNSKARVSKKGSYCHICNVWGASTGCCKSGCKGEWSGVEWSGVEWSGVEWSGAKLEQNWSKIGAKFARHSTN